MVWKKTLFVYEPEGDINRKHDKEHLYSNEEFENVKERLLNGKIEHIEIYSLCKNHSIIVRFDDIKNGKIKDSIRERLSLYDIEKSHSLCEDCSKIVD